MHCSLASHVVLAPCDAISSYDHRVKYQEPARSKHVQPTLRTHGLHAHFLACYSSIHGVEHRGPDIASLSRSVFLPSLNGVASFSFLLAGIYFLPFLDLSALCQFVIWFCALYICVPILSTAFVPHDLV